MAGVVSDKSAFGAVGSTSGESFGTTRPVDFNGKIGNSDSRAAATNGDPVGDSHRGGVAGESVSHNHRTTVLGVLEKAGFVLTGQPFSFVDKGKLDESTALSSLRKSLDTRMGETKDLDMLVLQETMTERIGKINFDGWSCKIGIVEGCAGSGKTTALLDCKKALGPKALVITHSTDQLQRTFHGVSGVYTVLDVMTREENFSEPHVLLVDEYTRLHMCEIICCAAFLGARNVILFGDPRQGLSHGLGSEKHYAFSVIARSNVCHRLPEEGRKFFNQVTGHEVAAGANTEKGIVDCGELYDSIPDSSVVFCFTQASLDQVSKHLGTCMLVTDVQGQTFDDVTLYIFERDFTAMSDPDILEPAFSRARRTLCVRFESPEVYAKLLNRVVGQCCKHKSTAQI